MHLTRKRIIGGPCFLRRGQGQNSLCEFTADRQAVKPVAGHRPLVGRSGKIAEAVALAYRRQRHIAVTIVQPVVDEQCIDYVVELALNAFGGFQDRIAAVIGIK